MRWRGRQSIIIAAACLLAAAASVAPAAAIVPGAANNESRVDERQNSDELQHKRMKSAMASLLEISDGDPLPARTRTTNMVAGYMQRLYAAGAGVSTAAGTIRSITPVIDIRDGVEVLVFPLGALREGDRLVRAELNFLGSSPSRAARLLMPVVKLLPHDDRGDVALEVSSIDDVSVRWSVLRPLLKAYAGSSGALVVRLDRTDGRRLRPLHSLVRRHAPFLTVHTRSDEEEEAAIRERRDETGARLKRHATSASADGYFGYGDENVEASIERARSQFLRHGPSMLNTAVKKRKFSRKQYEKKKSKQPWYGFNEPEEEEETARLIKVGGEEAELEKPADVGRSLDTTTAVNADPAQPLSVVLLDGKAAKQTICSRRAMHVDFAELGWSEWVLAPKSFEANFCAGECPFPLPKEARASNHALVQSVLASAPSSGLPPVCCAPDRMDSLTLLYMDPHGNVVLRSFPRMLVSSCGCI